MLAVAEGSNDAEDVGVLLIVFGVEVQPEAFFIRVRIFFWLDILLEQGHVLPQAAEVVATVIFTILNVFGDFLRLDACLLVLF